MKQTRVAKEVLMHDDTSRPRRMRYSFEVRCRAVWEMLSGVSPARAAATVGASRATGYRWLGRFREGGWPALRERSSTPGVSRAG